MECSTSELEGQQSFRSPPKRRRSTFFIRRESIAPATHDNDENADIHNINSDPTKSRDFDIKHQENLSSYFNKLLEEKDQWKKEVKNRRDKYHDLKQQYQIAAKAQTSSRISYSELSNDDIDFLKAKPDIPKLVETISEFHESVKETMALWRRMKEIDDVILISCDKQIDKVTQHIQDNSTIDIEEP